VKKQDEKRFLLLISKLAIAFREKVSEEHGRLYAEYLKEFPIEKIEKAVDRAIKELKWFPKIAELRDFILDDFEYDYLESQSKVKEIQTESGMGFSEISHNKEQEIEVARKFLEELHGKWERQEQEEERDRVIRFEERRERLRKQAKMLLGGE
jgi:hypothetical protein